MPILRAVTTCILVGGYQNFWRSYHQVELYLTLLSSTLKMEAGSRLGTLVSIHKAEISVYQTVTFWIVTTVRIENFSRTQRKSERLQVRARLFNVSGHTPHRYDAIFCSEFSIPAFLALKYHLGQRADEPFFVSFYLLYVSFSSLLLSFFRLLSCLLLTKEKEKGRRRKDVERNYRTLYHGCALFLVSQQCFRLPGR